MNKYTLVLCIIIALGSLSACKGTRKISNNSGTLNANSVFEQLIKHQTNANWLDAQLKITYKDASMTQTASASVRMKKDSVVWISVKKLGFELVRAQVTEDSVYFIDRFNQKYAVEDLNFLSKMYNLPASLQTLQALLLGNPIFFANQNWELAEAEQLYHLFHKGEKSSDFWIDKTNWQLHAMGLQDGANKIYLKLEDYQLNDAQQYFSHIRKIEVTSTETENLNLELEFTKVELNQPKTIRFEIPSNYTRMD